MRIYSFTQSIEVGRTKSRLVKLVNLQVIIIVNSGILLSRQSCSIDTFFAKSEKTL